MEISHKRRKLGSDGEFSSIVQDLADVDDVRDDGAQTKEETWEGWAEIESDPAFFNVMLKEMGVEAVSVREIFSLDDEMLDLLPRPVYGVIFLFKWREDEEFTDSRYKPGSKIWFANQTVSNACATYALLNIINNIPVLRLGQHLESFRDFTRDFSPALRGDAVANFEFVKRIHNSFARKMDRLNGDRYIESQVYSSRRESNKSTQEPGEDTAHHFIAFMPMDGVIWKMDGLESGPRSLGKIKHDDWLHQIKAEIGTRMSKYEDDHIDFAILGVIKDPKVSSMDKLAVNVKSLQHLIGFFEKNSRDSTPVWHSDGLIIGPEPSYGLTKRDVDAATIPSEITVINESFSHAEITSEIEKLSQEQLQLRLSIKTEDETQREDAARVMRRRHDCGDAILHWLRYLVQRKAVKSILDEST